MHFIPNDDIYIYFRVHDEQTVMVVMNNNDSENLNLNKYMQLMWSICLTQHESVRHIIYTSILHLCQKVTIKEINYIYNLLKEVPLIDYDQELIDFLKKFSHLAISKYNNQKDKSDELYGIPIYWKLFREESLSSKVSNSILIESNTHLKELFRLDQCKPKLNEYILKLINVMKEKKSIEQSLDLLLQ